MQLELPILSTFRRFVMRRDTVEPFVRRRLAERQTLKIPGRGETPIYCIRGRLWITAGDGRDVILRDGERWVARGGTLTIVEALEDSSVEISNLRV